MFKTIFKKRFEKNFSGDSDTMFLTSAKPEEKLKLIIEDYD
jgi:hypothetical protein